MRTIETRTLKLGDRIGDNRVKMMRRLTRMRGNDQNEKKPVGFGLNEDGVFGIFSYLVKILKFVNGVTYWPNKPDPIRQHDLVDQPVRQLPSIL